MITGADGFGTRQAIPYDFSREAATLCSPERELGESVQIKNEPRQGRRQRAINLAPPMYLLSFSINTSGIKGNRKLVLKTI